MPSVADVFLRLRVNPNSVKNDVEAGLKRVDTRAAGGAAGKQYGDEFGKKAATQISGHLKQVNTLVASAALLAPAIATIGGASLGAVAGLSGAFVAGAGALAAYGAVAKPVLSDALKASQKVTAAQTGYNAAIKAGVPTAQAHLALQAANAKAQATYNAALQSGTSPAKALAAYHAALAKNQLAYNAATSTGAFNARQYAAEQKAITAAYAGMTPQQIAVSKQLGVMSKQWRDLKDASTPLIAGSMAPWLKAISDAVPKLGPIIASVSPVIGRLGRQFDDLITSQSFTRFRDFIAGTGSRTVGAGGSTAIDLLKAFMIVLPQFTPLINDAVKGIGGFGPAVLRWAGSKKTSDEITAFMAWFKANGPVVGETLRNLGGALKNLAPGLASGGALELKVISDFLGLVARMPAGLAGPLAEVAGAAVILAKLPGGGKVISYLVKGTLGGAFAGLGGKETSAVEGGILSKLMPAGVKWAVRGGIAFAAVDIALNLIPSGSSSLAKNPLDKPPTVPVVGKLPQAFETPFGMPGPNDPRSSGNWLTSWAPYEHLLTVDIPHWWDLARHDVKTAMNDVYGATVGVVIRIGHNVETQFDSLRHSTATTFDLIRHDVKTAMNDVYGGTVGVAIRIGHDVETQWNSLRHGTAVTFDGARRDTASTMSRVYSDTIGFAVRIGKDVAARFSSLRHETAVIFDGSRHDTAATWSRIYSDTIGVVVRLGKDGISHLQSGFITPFKRDFQDGWNWVVTNVWNPVGRFFTSTLPGWFSTAVSKVGSFWSALQGKVLGPVKWVFQHVIDPLAGGFDAVTSALGFGRPIPAQVVKGWATGGRVNQGTTSTADDVLARVSRNETIVSAAHSRILAPAFAAVGVPGYAAGGIPLIGGIVGAAGGALKTALNGIIPGLGSILGAAGGAVGGALMSKLIGAIAGRGTGGAGGIMKQILGKMISEAGADMGHWLSGKQAAQAAAIGGQHVANLGSGVTRWAGLVRQALAMEGLSAGLVSNVLYQMQTESGGNPNAINLTDSNAAAGDPSKGLMQVIGATFRAFHWPGTSGNIYDPLANIAAALSYGRATYGPTLMRGGMGIGSGHGYRNGGPIPEPVYGLGALSGSRYSFEAGENVQSHDAAMAQARRLDAVVARLDMLIAATKAMPAAVGHHVGGAVGGIGSDAAMRGRYPAGR